MDLLIVGLFGGWILRMVFDRNERARTAEEAKAAYWDRCTARQDAEFVERLLVSEIREL